MKTEIEIEIEGPDGELIAACRDEIANAVKHKINQLMKAKAVKLTNTCFSTKTRAVHE